MAAAKRSLQKFIGTPCLLAFSCLGNFAYSYECTPQAKVESIRQQSLSAQDNYIAATREYLASMRKAHEMRTTVHDCQSGQTITGGIFGSCNDVVMMFNARADQTNNLESQKDSLMSLAQFFLGSYQTAAATACKQ